MALWPYREPSEDMYDYHSLESSIQDQENLDWRDKIKMKAKSSWAWLREIFKVKDKEVEEKFDKTFGLKIFKK